MSIDDTLAGDMTLAQILAIPGIVIRLIPKQTTSTWVGYRDGKRFSETNTVKNSLGGQYIITFVKGQGDTVKYSLSVCGVGDTIEDAYVDWVSKN